MCVCVMCRSICLWLHSRNVTGSVSEIGTVYQVSTMENFGDSKVNGSKKKKKKVNGSRTDNPPLLPNSLIKRRRKRKHMHSENVC